MKNLPSHLCGLPRWRGLPVPYINAWGDELNEAGWGVRPDPLVGADAWFATGTRGIGEPDFTKQVPQRQREVMVLRLCQVCREPIGRGPKAGYLIVSSISARDVAVDGFGEATALSEPWLCRRCLPFTLAHCPGLRRRDTAGDLTVIRVHTYQLIVSLMSHDHHPGVEACWVKVVPDRFDIVELNTTAAIAAALQAKGEGA